MKNIFLSIRPTIFVSLVISATLVMAACQPVAIMMPQTGVIDGAGAPSLSSYGSGAQAPAAGEIAAPALSDVFAHGYYVRAPGYVAAQDVFAHGYYVRAPGYMAAQDVFAHGYYVRAPGYMAEESTAGIIDVAATPYFK